MIGLTYAGHTASYIVNAGSSLPKRRLRVGAVSGDISRSMRECVRESALRPGGRADFGRTSHGAFHSEQQREQALCEMAIEHRSVSSSVVLFCIYSVRPIFLPSFHLPAWVDSRRHASNSRKNERRSRFVELERVSWVCPSSSRPIREPDAILEASMASHTNAGGQDRLFSSSLALGLGDLVAADLDALQDVLAVLVELQLGDDDVAGVDAEGNGGTGGLVAGDTLNVDDVFETVDRGNLALLVLVGATHDLDLVILTDGDGANLQGGSCQHRCHISSLCGELFLTLYFSRSSLLRGALMMLRRTLEGALKCALRDLRLEEWMAAEHVNISANTERSIDDIHLHALTLVIVTEFTYRRGRRDRKNSVGEVGDEGERKAKFPCAEILCGWIVEVDPKRKPSCGRN